MSQWEVIEDIIPKDRAVQVNAQYYIDLVVPGLPEGAVVVDLGCGAGRSKGRILASNAGIEWVGVDIASSPEAEMRPMTVRPFVNFDGVRLPFADGSVTCVFCEQVLEHVRYPDALLAEVSRVLAPGGSFIGTTSNLEPYHSFSYWNFTIFGFKTIVEDAGMDLIEVRPGIDGPTLIERQYKSRPPEMSKYFVSDSPLNTEILEWGAKTKRRPALVNNRMLQYCGHFGFHAVQPSESSTG